MQFDTKPLSAKLHESAPDGSEIRLLARMNGGGLCHCTLPPNATSSAVAHTTVEEIGYFIQGQGQVWRKLGEQEEVVNAHPGVSLTIPPQPSFNSATPRPSPYATMPPWPGPHEAISVPAEWPTRRAEMMNPHP